MIIPGFPVPFIGGPISYDVTFGTVDVTVAEQAGKYGFWEGAFGSIRNNSLIAVDGNLATINVIYSTNTNNVITLLFNNNAEASAAFDAINAEFSSIIGGANNFTAGVSDFSLSTNSLVLDAADPRLWASEDIGNIETVGWV